MDLHDGIIQSIYAIGLMLEGVQFRVEDAGEENLEGIGSAIRGLNDVIRDLRKHAGWPEDSPSDPSQVALVRGWETLSSIL